MSIKTEDLSKEHAEKRAALVAVQPSAVQKRAASAAEMLASWEKKLQTAKRMQKKWKSKVRYYQKRGVQ